MFPIYENLFFEKHRLPFILYHFQSIHGNEELIECVNYTSNIKRKRFVPPCGHEFLHWHNNIEVLMITGDRTEFSINGEIIKPSIGDIILVDAFDIHSIGVENAHYAMLIDVSQLESIGGNLHIFPFETSNKWIKFEGGHELVRSHIEEHILNIRDYLNDEDTINRLAIYGQIYLLLDSIYKYTSSLEENNYSSLNNKNILKKVFKFIEQNFTESILLSDIAQVAGFNESYFCRFFKSKTGRTFTDYLNEYRSQVAKRRIENTDDSITKIALESGFSSTSYFSRIFKKYFEMSPRAYRKILDENR